MVSSQHSVLAVLSDCCPHLEGRLPTRYSPVCHSTFKSKLSIVSFDLHVLSTPPAFVLSQDQTLHKISVSALALTDISATCRQANSLHSFLKSRYGSQLSFWYVASLLKFRKEIADCYVHVRSYQSMFFVMLACARII